MAAPVARPMLRATFFVLWAVYLALSAFSGPDRWFYRWPMAGFAIVALGIGAHFLRVGMRQRESGA